MEHLGRYEILEELGRGSMGRVYRGRDPQIDRVVALKTVALTGIDPALEEDFRQRFLREAKAAGRLSHGGIVTIYDAGENPATKMPFIVMEYIEGASLEKLAQERLPREQALDLAQQIAQALDYAHSQQIVHRDIKPANIIVTPDGRAKITDFGIAKLQTSQLTLAGHVMGTPSYMSPEQLTGEPVDGRSDLFSLGVILYWLLTGEKPFTGESLATLTFKVVYSHPLRPTQLNPGLGPDFDYVIHQALAKDPTRRYQSGREFAEDLEDLKNKRPPRSHSVSVAATKESAVTGVEPPAVAPSGLDRRRRRLQVAAAAGVLVLILLAVGWWLRGSRSPTDRSGTPASGAEQTGEAMPGTGSATTQRGGPEPAQRTTAPSARRPVAQAILQLRGKHSFQQATLNVYADGKLLRRLNLSTKEKSEEFTARMTLAPGERVISVSLSEPGGSPKREFITGRFRAGQARTLQIRFTGRGRFVGRSRLDVRWLD